MDPKETKQTTDTEGASQERKEPDTTDRAAIYTGRLGETATPLQQPRHLAISQTYEHTLFDACKAQRHHTQGKPVRSGVSQ